jgi:WD40 repeat protein
MFDDVVCPSISLGAPARSKFSAMSVEMGTDTCDFVLPVEQAVQVVTGVEVGCQMDGERVGVVKGIKGAKGGKSRGGKSQGESKRADAEDEGKNGGGDSSNDDYSDDEDASGSSPASSSSLLSFLQSVTPTMLSELNATYDSSAFDSFGTASKAGGGAVEHLYSMHFAMSNIVVENKKHKLGEFGDDAHYGSSERKSTSSDHAHAAASSSSSGVAVTAVTWTCTGSSLVAAYGESGTYQQYSKTGFCTSQGYVTAWSLNSNSFQPQAPSFTYEHSSHILSLAAHPTDPSLVAAGSFNGEVLLLDTSVDAASSSGDSPLKSISPISDDFHREPVTSVTWIYNAAEAAYDVASVSTDGRVLIWTAAKLKCPIRGIRVLACLPNSSQFTKASTVGCLAIAAETGCRSDGAGAAPSDSLYVGSTVGNLVRLKNRDSAPAKPPKMSGCDMKWSTSAAQALHRIPVHQREEIARVVEKRAKSDKRRGVDLAAVYAAKIDLGLLYPCTTEFVYESHVGPVNSVAVSPFEKKILLTTGDDGDIKIFHTHFKAPLATAAGGKCTSAQWSKVRPCVFAVTDSAGDVSLYDVAVDDQEAVCVLQGEWKTPVVKVAAARDAEGDGGDENNAGNGDGSVAEAKAEVVDVVRFTKRSMNCVSFNHKIRNLVAAGDENGIVHVWKLPQELVSGPGGEKAEIAVFEEFWRSKSDEGQ